MPLQVHQKQYGIFDILIYELLKETLCILYGWSPRFYVGTKKSHIKIKKKERSFALKITKQNKIRIITVKGSLCILIKRSSAENTWSPPGNQELLLTLTDIDLSAFITHV